ncbi:MAG: hypothetical protein Q9183_001545 [Haloplaca sp. 2 TL-2023]
MSQSRSPLSPSSANCNTPPTIEKRTKNIDAAPFNIHQDTENLPAEDDSRTVNTNGHRTQSPQKPRSRSKSRSPRKADRDQARPVPLTEDALRENEGLSRAMDMMMNGGDSIVDLYSGQDAVSVAGTAAGYPGIDDTCFSTFSAVANTDMTQFAQLRQSPVKSSSPAKRSREAQYDSAAPTPRPAGRSTPATPSRQTYDDCSPSPTPRRPKSSRDGDDTNLILDFTEQFNSFSNNSRLTPRKFNTQPDLASFAASKRASPSKGVPSTPSRAHNLANLLDFDLPPAPTPRSIPIITARELESLKSGFLSQISSLRATLNGKEAEVSSLKEAVTDAERRVGEAQEEIRDQRGLKENLQADKEEWQARDKEMQSVLRNVKEEIIHEQHEHEKLQQRFEASERNREEAEARALEAESKIVGLQAASAASAEPPMEQNGQSTPGADQQNGGEQSAAVEAAVDRVARELHGLYKSKHETKVAALKKSYEARWEKKIKDLESRVKDLDRENEELKVGRDTTLSGVVSGPPHPHRGDNPESKTNTTQDSEEQRIRIESLAQEVDEFRHENATLQQQLEIERLEMAELVRATEEMMQLSLQPSSNTSSQKDEKASGSRRGSVSKPGPSTWKQSSVGHGESRIGRMAGGGGSVGSSRSGIMSNIERMGRGRAVD